LSPLVRHLVINSVLLHENKQICGNYATRTHGKLPRDFKFIFLTRRKGYQLVSRPLLGPHRRCTRVWLRCRWPHQLYINFVVRRDYSSPGRTGSTSTTPCAATTRLPVAQALPQPCHAPSRRSISRRSVALALAVRLVTASRGATTRRPDCTGSIALMPCIRTRRLAARLLVGRSHWLSSCVRSLRLAARLLVVQIASTLLRLCRASGCLGTSRGSSSTTSPTPRVRVPRHVARLVTRLVVDYFDYAVRPGASARRAAHHATRRRLLHLRCASGCLGTSRGSPRGSSRRLSSTTPRRAGSSSTTLPPPRVWVPRHVARLITWLVTPLVIDYSASRRLVVDYFTSSAHPGASARRAVRHTARRAARRRLLRLA
jgi:hypothetical protein